MSELKLINSRFTKLNANRNPDFSGEISIKTSVKINNLEVIKNTDSLKINYSFEVNYGELGQIFIEGILFISSDQETVKKIQTSWKDKKIEDPLYISITNAIMQKASIKALELEEELSLPIHFKLPKIEIKK
jgi:hypothetical protein